MNLDYLKKLCLAAGVSGNEAEVREIILEEIKPYADNITISPLGDIIAEKKGKLAGKKIMIDAHMDEVGFIVSEITEGGLLRFIAVGGVNSSVLPGKTVYVNGKIPGVIGGKPIHLMDSAEREKVVPMSELTIDIGAKDKEEAETVVSVGDYVNFEAFFECSRGTVKAKALDDRMGCAVLTELIKKELPCDVTFSFSTREEIGGMGSKVAAYAVKPEICIAVEGTVAGDVLGTKGAKACTKIGAGPAISIKDKGTVYDRAYFKAAFETAAELNIPCQARTSSVGSNNAGEMHIAGTGARPMGFSVPCRYIHCPTSLCSLSDADNAVELLYALLGKINEL